MIETTLNQLSQVPTFYLLLMAIALYRIGRIEPKDGLLVYTGQRIVSGFVFLALLLNRLFNDVPYAGDDAIAAVLRAAAFGGITFGVIGISGAFVYLIYASILKMIDTSSGCWRACNRFVRSKLPAPKQPQPSAGELRRRELEDQRWQAQQEKHRCEQRRREELRMQLELDIEFDADRKRRERVDDYLEKYAGTNLPIDEYEKRVSAIREAVMRHAPKRTKQFESLQEIIEDFDKRFDELERSVQSDFEKATLRSLLEMERQATIERFIQQ